jgi:hypothetical protein
VFRAQGEAAVHELFSVGRPESECTTDGGSFLLPGEGEQDLAAGGGGHGPAGGFDSVGDAAGGAVFDDVPPSVLVPDIELEAGALGGAVLLGVRAQDAPPEQGGVGVALKVDGLLPEGGRLPSPGSPVPSPC